MISVEGLGKRFGPKWAVNEVSFTVDAGEIVGYLGPNGAGKTTTLRLLLGLLTPTSGRAEIFGLAAGRDSAEINRRVGVVLEAPGLYGALTVRENLAYFGRIHGLRQPALDRRIDRTLEEIGVADRAGDKVSTLSKGLAQRAAIARALLHEPEILLLDEPTAGLDPVSQRDVRELVRRLAQQGKTIFFSSHNLHEVEEVARRVLILNRGRLVEADSLEAVLEHHASPRVELEMEDAAEAATAREWVSALPYVSAVEVMGRRLVAHLSSMEDAPRFREALLEKKARFRALRSGVPSLEEVYVQLVSEGAEIGEKP